MLVASLDPGLSAAGLARVRTDVRHCVRAWTVRTDTSIGLEERFRLLAEHIEEALDGAELMAVEDQHGTFHAMLRAGRSNPAAGRLERVVGIAHGLATARGIPVVMVTPTRVRSLLGVGKNSGKAQIARAVRMRCNGVSMSASHHAVDAVAIALTGAQQYRGHELLTRVVKAALG